MLWNKKGIKMGKRKYRQIITCLLSATLTGSLICSSIVFASETTSEKIQELDKSSISIKDTKEDTETVNRIEDSQVKTTVSSNQEAKEVQPFAENNNAGDFNVTGDTKGWTYESGANTLTFTAGGEYTVTGDGTATTERIIVSESNITATITLNNVNIDVSTQNDKPAFYAKSNDQSKVNLTIVLEETNILKSGEAQAGLTWSNTDDNSILEIKGEGSLTATGGKLGAGIGGCAAHKFIGRDGSSTRNIKISSGTITALGGESGAGIGGGYRGAANNIIIGDGTVTAKGGYDASGIGTGSTGLESNITISGGTVTATGGNHNVGIGGGDSGSGSNITISGGMVTATGGEGQAGIGGGNQNVQSNITISGGIVTATGGSDSAGIGGGNYSSGGNITISDGTVVATGGSYGAGIGGGYSSSGSNITISGGTVTATGGSYGAGIGDYGSSTSNIIISNGSVKATSISTTPTDGNGSNVYLAKLDNLSGVNSVSVDNTNTYTRNVNHEGNDGAFYLYLVGGTDHEIVTSGVKYIAKWNGSDGFTVIQPTPKPTFNINKTANSITVKPTNYKSGYGTIEYKWDDGNWETSDTLSNLKSSSSHTVSIRYAGQGAYIQSEEATQTISTNGATYNISIPTTPLVAGNTDSTAKISINDSQPFDLGHNGQVNVKVSNQNVSTNGILTLSRTNDTQTMITSTLLVNGKPFSDISKSVATFKTSADSGVSVSFGKPTESNILAGTYKGMITFEVSYSEQ